MEPPAIQESDENKERNIAFQQLILQNNYLLEQSRETGRENVDLNRRMEEMNRRMEEMNRKMEEMSLQMKEKDKQLKEKDKQVKVQEQQMLNLKEVIKAQKVLTENNLFSVSFADIYDYFAKLVTVQEATWIDHQSYYEVKKVEGSMDTLKEENVQNIFNQVLSYSGLALAFQDTSTQQYLNNRKKPDLTFFGKTQVFYAKSIMTDFAVAVGELKNSSKNIDTAENLGQILFYMFCLVNRHRKQVYGFLSNYNSIIFLKMNSNFTVERTRELTNVFRHTKTTTQVRYIKSFLDHAHKESHFEPPLQLHNCTISNCLGEGRTSSVYEVQASGITRSVVGAHSNSNLDVDISFALKVKHQTDDTINTFDNEVRLLQLLSSQIPDFKQHYPEVVLSGTNFIMFRKLYVPLESKHLSGSVIVQFCCFLKEMHEQSVFHRDIRIENLMWSEKDKCIVLIDFGFASTKQTDLFAGTLTFAANELLQSLKFHAFVYECDYYAKYDIESFIKCIFYLISKNSKVDNFRKRKMLNVGQFFGKFSDVLELWTDIENDNQHLSHILLYVRQECLSESHITDFVHNMNLE